MEYLITKWLHVLAAVVALGSNLTYGVWLSLASHDRTSLVFALRGIRYLDSRIANPSYVVLLATGLFMVYLTGIPLSTPWLFLALILYVFTALIGILAYAPALRRQVLLAENPGSSSPDYVRAAKTSLRLGLLTIAIVVVIVFLMVVKPALW